MANKDQPELTASDFNLEKLSTPQLSAHIAGTIDIGGNIAIFGRRGTGKTEISRQQIKAAGLREVYINLSVMERTDLGGYPDMMSPHRQDKFVSFLMPRIYQPMMEGKQKIVALLDEVDKADPSLWAPLLEFTQFRSINGTELPNLHAIITTGNLISEGGNRPSLPLLDRSEKYLVEADAASWLDWTGKIGGIHPSITSFINDNPGELFGAPDPEDRYADPSPRGWTRASDILFKGEARKWDEDLLRRKVYGCVGKTAGIKYSMYYDHYQKLMPMIEALYQGEDVADAYLTLDPSKQLIACMMACARLAVQLDQTTPTSTLPPTLIYMGKFLRHASYENILASVRTQLRIQRIIKFKLDDNKDWQPILSMVNQAAATPSATP